MTSRGDEARGIDALIRNTDRVEHIKTSYYLRPEQMELLDTARAALRRAGVRTANASMLMRAALELAAQHPEEWTELAKREAS